MRIVYVIGAPGVGKTTAFRSMLSMLPPGCCISMPIKAEIRGPAAIIGSYGTGTFSGTDTLSYTCAGDVKRFIEGFGAQVVFAEGDRLSNPQFFDWCKSRHDFTLVYFALPAVVLEQRLRLRGSRQNPVWIKGRITKVNRLSGSYVARAVNADREPAEIARELLAIAGLTPVR